MKSLIFAFIGIIVGIVMLNGIDRRDHRDYNGLTDPSYAPCSWIAIDMESEYHDGYIRLLWEGSYPSIPSKQSRKRLTKKK